MTEEEADKTVEQFAEAIQSAEKLSFLDEQQLYDLERQFHAQQSRLSEAQTALAERESRLSDAQRRIGEVTAVLQAEKEEAARERETPQWRVLAIPAGETEGETENAEREIHGILSNWGARKPRGIVETVEDWIAELVSGKTVFLDGGNTIELTMFDQKQRDQFVETVLPLILARKNLECFVQEHKRREVDFRITVVNREETIPAIVVPDESGVGASENGAEGKEADRQEGTKKGSNDGNDANDDDVDDVCRYGGSEGVVKGEEEKEEKGEEHPEVVFVQEMVEEESEELRISEMDAISRDVIQSIPEVKEKRRKAKMINLDWAVCSHITITVCLGACVVNMIPSSLLFIVVVFLSVISKDFLVQHVGSHFRRFV